MILTGMKMRGQRSTRSLRIWFRTCVCITVLYAPFMYGLLVLCNSSKNTSVFVLDGGDTVPEEKYNLERSFMFPKSRLSRRVVINAKHYEQDDDDTNMHALEKGEQYNGVLPNIRNKQNAQQTENKPDINNEMMQPGMQKQTQPDTRLSNGDGNHHANKPLNRNGQPQAIKPDNLNGIFDNIRYEQNRPVKTGPMSDSDKGDVKEEGVPTTQHQNITARPKHCAGCFNSDFPYIIDQPELCRTRGNQTVDVIFLILTSYTGRRRRDAIRDTWASVTRNNTSNLRHVFLLGNIHQDQFLQQVREESALYRDVLVSDFRDSYQNLTLKTMMGLRFFMKVDDDVWVNTRRLLKAAAKREGLLQTRLGGMCRHTTVIIRDPNLKWYMSPDYFPYDYPPYCVGLGYVGGMNAAEGVVKVSKDVPFFSLEDVYVGLCLEAAGFGIVAIGGFVHNYPRQTNDTCKPWRIIAAHPIYADNMRLVWNATCEI